MPNHVERLPKNTDENFRNLEICWLVKILQKLGHRLSRFVKNFPNWFNVGDQGGTNAFGRSFTPPPLRDLPGVWKKKAFDKYPANNFHSCEHEDPANNNAMVQL